MVEEEEEEEKRKRELNGWNGSERMGFRQIMGEICTTLTLNWG